ncbi:MAG: AsmA family protein [Thermodesulfobacteriota bacterium]
MKKNKIIIFSLVIALLLATAVTIIHYLELNRLKPVIGQIVKHYTGRELTINGDIRLLAHWPPTLAVEDVAFQNAPWGSQPHMIRVKRAAFAVSLTSLLRGEFRFFEIRLDEPEVLLEFNPEGESNFLLDIPATEGDVVIPVLAFNDILIQNGYFEYNDRKHDLKASVHVDDLEADIPGLDKPMQILFEGSFRGLPLSLDGSIGPIIAWIQPGNTLPVNLSTRLGMASARLEGDIRDPVHLKDISLVFMADGPSTREMATLINWGSIPDLGTFTVKAELTDRPGQFAIDKLDATIGSPDHVSFSVGGRVDDLVAMKALDLNLGIQTNHTGNLMLLTGLPAPPFEAPLTATVRLSDTTKNQYRLDDFLVSVGDRTIEGRMGLNLTRAHSVLDMELQSGHPTLGPVAFKTRMSGSLDRISVEHLELHMGHDNLFKAFIVGAVGSLSPIEDLSFNFHLMGKDLARLQQLTGRPLPVHGPYVISGALSMANRQAMQVPDLKIILDKSSINGSLGLDMGSEYPILYGNLTSNRLNLERLLKPGTVPDNLRKSLSSVGPSQLAFELSGPIERPVLNSIAMQTQVENLAAFELKGSIKNLLTMTGTDLYIAAKGNDLANLGKVVGRDIPFKGPYGISASLNSPAKNTYHFENLNVFTVQNTFNGRSTINLSDANTVVSVKLGTKNISLAALAEGQNAVLDRLRSKTDLGPLEVDGTAVLSAEGQRLQTIDLAFGRTDFVRMQVKGSVGSLPDLKDLKLDIDVSGNNIAELEPIVEQPIPVKGPYALSGEVSGHVPGSIKIRDLDLVLERNRFKGWADLNLVGKVPEIDAEISAEHLSLEPVTLKQITPLKDIPDLGPFQLAVKLSERDGAPAITQLDFRLGKESTILAIIRGSAGNLDPIGEVSLEVEVHSQDLSILDNLYGFRFAGGKPFHAIGRLHDPRPKNITVSSLEMFHGDNDLSGTAALDLTGPRPSLNAHLSSDKLDLRPLSEKIFPDTPEPRPPARSPSRSRRSNKRLFSREALDFKWLQQIDAHVAFQGREVLGKRLAFNDVVIQIKLREGDLNVDPLKFNIGGGSAEGTFALQSGNSPPFMATSLAVHHFDIGPMLEQLGQESTLQGTLNTSIYLNGRGNSVAALMAGLNGKVHLDIHDGRVESRQLALLERYLGSNVLNLVNPFIHHPKHTTINCLISTTTIKDGVAEFKMVLDTDQTALASAGTIDLKTEGLDIAIKPMPKKGFGDRNVGYITFSLSELSQPFGLGGTLTNPQLVLDPTRTVITAAKFAGAWLLGPVGMALFFTDISMEKKNICEEASGTN